MKKSIYIALLFLLVLGACKNNKSIEDKFEGFVIKGKMEELPKESLAVLSYKQKDSTIIDTAIIENGTFSFKGKVIHPSEATIRVRHGEKFPENSWKRDTYYFFIDNSEMKLTTTDSVKKASLEGSLLTNQSLEIAGLINPLTNNIIALQNRMKGRSKEDKMITYDTVQIYVDSIKAVVHQFIMSHPNSYVSLQRFLRHEMPKNFDPIVADKEYNDLFGDDLKQTPTGKLIANKIAIAKKSQLGKEAMDFTQTDLNGESFKLSSLKGKYVLVDFWASWCKPCRAENPFVIKAYNKYKTENFEIVGVSLDADKTSWEKAIEKDGLPWIHVSDLRFWKNEVAVQYGINSVPSNILINPEGIIIDKNLRGEALTNRLSEIFDKG